MKALLARYKIPIRYGVFGIVTIAVSFVFYALTVSIGSIALTGDQNTGAFLIILAKIISWIAATITAYLVNMFFVFRYRPPNMRALTSQLLEYFATRIFSLILGTLLTLSFKYILQHFAYDASGIFAVDNLSWILGSVLEIFINYFVAKFLIFRQTTTKTKVKELEDI